MKIEYVELMNFKNFKNAKIKLNGNTLLIGSNDVGKTNFFSSIRILLDRSLPEISLEPQESDFFIDKKGRQANRLSITIKISEVTEDAVISQLKGFLNDDAEFFLCYVATRKNLNSRLLIGHDLNEMEEIDSRFYLKSIHLTYIESTRYLEGYIKKERRNLLRVAKDSREESEAKEDLSLENSIKKAITKVNEQVSSLTYVERATESLNDELKKLSHHNSGYSVGFEAKNIDFSNFVDQLSLSASTGGPSLGVGGDGRNNQILLSLWKAKMELEHDYEDEGVIYCIEEPEAHLHPHQQRKLADYLVNSLNGQVLTSTHSPSIAAEYPPNQIVRLLEEGGSTKAANGGCSLEIDESWKNMGYRMTVLPAEALFSNGTFLVEGPSEVLLYKALAKQIEIDIDFHNISILSVDGIDFAVYVKILDALEIPWVLRTDNDVFKVPRSNPVKYTFSGLNRARRLVGKKIYKSSENKKLPTEIIDEYIETSSLVNPQGVYISIVDLETDLATIMEEDLIEHTKTDNIEDAIEVMKSRKAINMGAFIASYKHKLSSLKGTKMSEPLEHLVKIISSDSDRK